MDDGLISCKLSKDLAQSGPKELFRDVNERRTTQKTKNPAAVASGRLGGLIVMFLMVVLLRSSKASEVMFLVDRATRTNTVFSVTNSTDRSVFILPICLPEQFYPADKNCTNCFSGWGVARPVPLGQWRDFIPLASGESFTFTFDKYYARRWRITCIASRNPIHIDESGSNSIDITNRLEIHSAEFAPGRPRVTGTNGSRN
ncbi:MAG TPA: hypothetical protein VNX46_10580 [Candidatus Acidoferrum sp.]|jgi:hypothetical protein|nr:hypothetical protein [Candidatus Acidoferrum sp.]